jgi:ABC-type Fe3+/spermidine/putrescine transport system ATPase subunit
MSEGRILQQGPPEQVYSRPRTRFVAGFIGLGNLWEARLAGRAGADYVVALGDGDRLRVAARDDGFGAADEVVLMVRPENIKFAATDAGPSPTANRLRVRVENVSFTGSIVNYFVRADGIPDPIRVQSTPPIIARPGEETDITFSPEAAVLLQP